MTCTNHHRIDSKESFEDVDCNGHIKDASYSFNVMAIIMRRSGSFKEQDDSIIQSQKTFSFLFNDQLGLSA